MFYEILFSAQVKRCTIITYKYGITGCLMGCIIFVNTREKTLEKQKLNFRRSALFHIKTRCGSRAAGTSKMEHFVIIVNGF